MHVLVMPERHVDTFRDVGEFGAGEAKRMLEFVAETAAKVGLTDYRVLVNVGASAGQTVFHLHWHILGGGPEAGAEVPAASRSRRQSELDRTLEQEVGTRCSRATPRAVMRCA